MPKKGLRRIVVDGKTYNYVIKPSLYVSPRNSQLTMDNRLTIELSKNKYHSEDIADKITPSMVEKRIRELR